MHWYDWFDIHCSLQNWYVCCVNMFPSWMIIRCCGLNVVGSQFVRMIWLLLLLLEKFIGKLHCALILIKYNRRYICFIFFAAVKPNECHSIKPKITDVVKPNEKFITAAVKPNECQSIKLHLLFPRNSIARRYISLGFSGQLIEVRGLFATSLVSWLDLLDVILHILRYNLIEVQVDEDTFP